MSQKKSLGDVVQLGIENVFEYLCRERKYGVPIALIVLGVTASMGTSESLFNQIVSSFLKYLLPNAMASLGVTDVPGLMIKTLGTLTWVIGLTMLVLELIASKWKEVQQTIVQATYNPIDTVSIKSCIDPENKVWKTIIHFLYLKTDNTKVSSVKKYVKFIKKKAARMKPTRKTFYCGVAHLPYVAFTGHLLRHFQVRFLEIDHTSRKKELLHRDQLPALKVNSTQYVSDGGSEVSLIVSVSRKIITGDVLKFKKCPLVEMNVDNIAFSNVKTEADLEMLTSEFRKSLENIYTANKNITKVNLFYAGPTSLMFRIGQNISSNTDKEVIVYNYDGERGYCWGISVNKGGEVVRLQ